MFYLVFINQKIGGLQIPVDDIILVHIVHPFRYVNRHSD